MDDRLRRILLSATVMLGLVASAHSSMPAEERQAAPPPPGDQSSLTQPLLSFVNGKIVLDYQVVPVANDLPLDLLGFHYLHQVTNWMYLGIGGYTTLVQGEYGGFMALDAMLMLQKKLIGNIFVDAGTGLGGGAGSRSIQHSKVLSGTGGLFRAFAGLGYDFGGFSAGIYYSRFSLANSAIGHDQLDLFVQIPVSNLMGPYALAGQTLTLSDQKNLGVSAPGPRETLLTFGSDNMLQLSPQGRNRSTINLFDVQYSNFFTSHAYGFLEIGIGYHGLPFYNQILGGVGYRLNPFGRLRLTGQLGLGSGGYAPSQIDTGPGLLVYPKVSAEYPLSKSLGASLTAGYLFAPRGSSKNVTLGGSLNYHLTWDSASPQDGGALSDVYFQGFRVHLLQQTAVNVKVIGTDLHNLNLLTLQLDNLLSDHFFVPIQASVAYNDFFGFPGYGELFTGLGLQSKTSPKNPFQTFAELLVGANVTGVLAKAELGLNYSLNANYALHGQIGHAVSVNALNQYDYSASSFGLGLSYQFSVPSR